MPSIFLFTPLYSTTGDRMYGIGYCHFTIFLNRQCVYLEILLYIFNLIYISIVSLVLNLISKWY